jgi:hypothetical protein
MMDRRAFLASLLGAVFAPAALAELEPAQTPALVIPRDRVDQWIAFEFLRTLIDEAGLAADGMLYQYAGLFDVRLPPERWRGVSLEARPDLPLDDLTERCIRPAAASLAQSLRDEHARGGRGLLFIRPRRASGPQVCHVVSDPATFYAARYLVAFMGLDPAYPESWGNLQMRFDVQYVWSDKQPLRPKKHALQFDPARLPA